MNFIQSYAPPPSKNIFSQFVLLVWLIKNGHCAKSFCPFRLSVFGNNFDFRTQQRTSEVPAEFWKRHRSANMGQNQDLPQKIVFFNLHPFARNPAQNCCANKKYPKLRLFPKQKSFQVLCLIKISMAHGRKVGRCKSLCKWFSLLAHLQTPIKKENWFYTLYVLVAFPNGTPSYHISV